MKKWMLLGALMTAITVARADAPAKDSAAASAADHLKADLDVLNKMDASNEKAVDAQAAKVLQEAHDFAAKYPGDPHAASATMLWIQLAGHMNRAGLAGAPSDAEIAQVSDQLASDKNAPAGLRAEIRAKQVLQAIQQAAQSSGDTSKQWAAIDDRFAAMTKEFGPDASLDGQTPLIPSLQQEEVLALESAGETPVTKAELQRLTQNSQPEIAAQAVKALDHFKLLAQLKTKPLDLKYTAADGREVDVAKLRGKVVLVDFWATWCPPCVAEVPKIVEAFQKHHSQGFEIVGVSLDQDKDAMTSFTARKGMSWPQYFDGQKWDNKISSSFGVDEVPQMWLLDKKGMLVATTDSIESIAPQISQLLSAP
jgi:thiol-disulfide isomerase/thioredoxin